MNIVFFLKEGMISLKRARVSALISIISICLALTLIGFFILFGQNLKDIFIRFYKEIEIEIFLDPSISKEKISTIKSDLAKYAEIKGIRFVSSKEALEEFQKIFGEEINSILEENPLPQSFRITLKPDYSNPDFVEKFALDVKKMTGIQEVIYQKEIIKFVHKYFNLSIAIISFLAILLFTVITILIYNTIRLTIHARRNIIQIMKLVGATNFFIKIPFIVEGIIQGLLGSGLSVALIWFASSAIRSMIFPGLSISAYLFPFIVGVGFFFGLVGSYMSVNKYLKYE